MVFSQRIKFIIQCRDNRHLYSTGFPHQRTWDTIQHTDQQKYLSIHPSIFTACLYLSPVCHLLTGLLLIGPSVPDTILASLQSVHFILQPEWSLNLSYYVTSLCKTFQQLLISLRIKAWKGIGTRKTICQWRGCRLKGVVFCLYADEK